MSKLKPLVGISVLALVALACGALPQVQLSFNTPSTTIPFPVAAAVTVTPPVPPTLAPSPTLLPPDLIQEADAEERLLINVYERVNPSVVSIQAITLGDFEHPSLPEGIPTPDLPSQPFPQQGEGSGFVVDTAGHIVTNNHVVADTTELRVTFFDGTTIPASVIGTDPDSDLAVIKVDVAAESLRPIAWGDSDQLHVGQRAIAIGNPFGYENTLTSGIISGLSRSLPAVTSKYRIPDIIQTDAAINPGNSGGPLLNSQGEVVGINSAIVPNFSQSGERSFLGVGFAIPSNLAQRVVPALIAEGVFDHPWIGFEGMDVIPEIASAMNLSEARGALVTRTIPGSPADKAGLRGGDQEIQVLGQPLTVGGDVIIAIDGEGVRHFDDILSYLNRRTEVGQDVQLTIIRNGDIETVTVTLGKRPSTT